MQNMSGASLSESACSDCVMYGSEFCTCYASPNAMHACTLSISA